VGDLEQLEAHPRTRDNLEVIRRWESVRAAGWLSDSQKTALRNLDQEHILLLDEGGAPELAGYRQIEAVAGGDTPVRAFLFERKAKIYVVFWHMSGDGSMEVPLEGGTIRLMAELGRPQAISRISGGLRLPLAGRLYLECSGVSRERIVRAFRNARIMN
jgi:hypothetical protein